MSEQRLPRLLVLTSTYPRWPKDHIPAFVHELARRLTKNFEVTVLAPHDPGAAVEETMDGVQVFRFRYAPERLESLAYGGGIPSNLKQRPWLTLVMPWFLTAQFLAALRLMRKLKPDIVHAHWLLPSGLIATLVQELASKRFRLVTTAHGADVHLSGNMFSRLLKREVLRSSDLVAVVSPSLQAELHRQMPSVKTCLAPMGVDLQSRFVPGKSVTQEPVLVFAGRLVEKKGVSDLLQAMPIILDQVPDTRLLIAGDGPLAGELRQLCRRMALENCVEFLRSVANDRLPELLRGAQVITLPFRIGEDGDQEGLGLVTIEAMGCGVPVLVGNVPAVSDVVTHDRTGWLVSSGQPQAIAEGVITLLGNPELRQRLATQARTEVVRKYDWAGTAINYRRVLLGDR
jgi:glycosyltransferase involved in cell wall biosynthesis